MTPHSLLPGTRGARWEGRPWGRRRGRGVSAPPRGSRQAPLGAGSGPGEHVAATAGARGGRRGECGCAPCPGSRPRRGGRRGAGLGLPGLRVGVAAPGLRRQLGGNSLARVVPVTFGLVRHRNPLRVASAGGEAQGGRSLAPDAGWVSARLCLLLLGPSRAPAAGAGPAELGTGAPGTEQDRWCVGETKEEISPHLCFFKE